MKQAVAVLIPIYKTQMTQLEKLSFSQSLNVLKNYPVVLVCPKGLDVSAYCKFSLSEYNKELLTEEFDPVFFKDIDGYNKLMLSECFYQRFSSFKYILICQLDSYLFCDELLHWCKKGYDFVGAPWAEIDEKGKVISMDVGNGGLSLRRVDYFLGFYKNSFWPFLFRSLRARIKSGRTYRKWLVRSLRKTRRDNKKLAESAEGNEDVFWCNSLDGTIYEPCKPHPKEALSFSFEMYPSQMYELNGQRLPFGCHAFAKYEYESFWKQFIPN